MAEENAEALTQYQQHQPHPNPNPLHNLFSLFQNFKLQLPHPNPSIPEASDVTEEGSKSKQTSNQKSAEVRFPERRPVRDSLKLHEDDLPEVTNAQKSPAVMWQIYAVGAIVIARWAWTSWQKRKNLKKSSDDD